MPSLLGSILGFINTGRAAKSVSNANIAAEHGVLGATSDAQKRIEGALAGANTGVTSAGEVAQAQVSEATGTANETLQGLLDRITGGLDPYTAAGKQGVQQLQDYTAGGGPKFSFNPDEFLNSDAYKFQLAQGQDAITNTAAARGLQSSGATLKELTNYGQGLASTYYQNAFNNALKTFTTNQDTTLSNLKTLIDTGMSGEALGSSAIQNLGGQQAQNTVNAGFRNADTTTSLAKFLASLNLGGAESSGQLGLEGATRAGNFAVGAGNAHGAGIIGQGTALTQGIEGIGSLLAKLGIGG